jgi:hypothetical protein
MERPVSIREIEAQLRHLPPEKLGVVYDFVSYLLERQGLDFLEPSDSDAGQLLLASERVLRRDWDRPEEDVAWEDL